MTRKPSSDYQVQQLITEARELLARRDAAWEVLREAPKVLAAEGERVAAFKLAREHWRSNRQR